MATTTTYHNKKKKHNMQHITFKKAIQKDKFKHTKLYIRETLQIPKFQKAKNEQVESSKSENDPRQCQNCSTQAPNFDIMGKLHWVITLLLSERIDSVACFFFFEACAEWKIVAAFRDWLHFMIRCRVAGQLQSARRWYDNITNGPIRSRVLAVSFMFICRTLYV